MIILTRKEFRAMYGRVPNWLWEILKQNYRDHIKNNPAPSGADMEKGEA